MVATCGATRQATTPLLNAFSAIPEVVAAYEVRCRGFDKLSSCYVMFRRAIQSVPIMISSRAATARPKPQ
jgi:hypothetical protein